MEEKWRRRKGEGEAVVAVYGRKEEWGGEEGVGLGGEGTSGSCLGGLWLLITTCLSSLLRTATGYVTERTRVRKEVEAKRQQVEGGGGEACVGCGGGPAAGELLSLASGSRHCLARSSCSQS
eukprot:760546-Hanusia_phi.AAC.1